MSANEKQQQAANSASHHSQQYVPPPPPGPPPIQTSQAPRLKHPDETPIPDYEVPSYNPAQPQFAPPQMAGDEDIYNASPTDQHPPKWGHSHHQHQETDGEAGKKKSNRLSAFGAAFSSKVAGPVNALAHKFGAEGFLPESLDKECEKAARILRGFCKDGIYSDTVPPTAASTTTTPATTTTTGVPAAEKPPASPSNKGKKGRVLLTIPSKVIARAQGLAIFTAVRLGFQATGSSGSGILLARLPDGSWSPPSGIQITSIGAGFVAGVDIYDCVIVINTREALEMFTKTRLSLGSDLAVTAGPFGAGGALDWGVPAGQREAERRGQEKRKGKAGEPYPATTTLSPPPLSSDNTRFQTGPVPEEKQGMGEEDAKEKAKRERRPSPFREAIKKPVYSYVKSRGLFAGVQIDGTVIAEREGANAKFYGQAVPVGRILKGEVPARGPPGMWPDAAKGLFDVLRGAEGWRGQQPGPGSPVSPGFGGPIPTGPAPPPGAAAATGPAPNYGNPPGPGTGAPPSTWVPPPSSGVPGVATGMQNLNVGGNSAAAGPSTGPSYPPPPTTAASAKAVEAAAEAAQSEHVPPPPPVYSELQSDQDLPPAYVEDERHAHAGQDSKTGQH